MTSSLDEGPATNPLTARKTSVVVEPVQADRPSSNPLSRGTVGSTVPDDDGDAHHRATPGNPLGQPSPTPRCNDRSYSEADSAEVPLFTPMERLRRLLFIFFVEWKLFYAALLAICLIISVLLLCECTYEYITAKNANDRVTLSLETARATYDTAAMCMQTQSVAPVPVPESLSSLMSDIKKHHKDKKSEYIPHLEEAIAYLEEGKCQLAVISVNNLFSIISGSVDTQKSMLFISDFIYAFSSGWTQLESQGLLQMTESTPVTSSRALTGSSTNLLCSKLILNYLMQNPSMEPLHGVLTCSSEITNTVVNYTPVVIPQGQSINSMSLFTSFLSYDWMGTTTSNFNVGLYLPHFILNGATIIICLVGLFVVLYVTQLQLRFDKKQLVVDRDFLVAHERKGVQLQPDTLRLLDYYCWKVGSLESPDLDELSQLLVDPDSIAHLVIQKYNAQVAQEAAQTTSDPFARALTSHSNKEDDVGSMASSAGGEQRIASRTQSKNDEITDVHPLLLQVSQRQKTLQHYARELAELRDATQLQLYMHHTAHPIALLRPFVPDHMMGVASFQLPDIAGLGPSVTAKHASSVLQEGLVAGQPAALLFVSFRPFNRPGAVGTAAQLYMRRADEAAAEALALARQQGGCCGGKAEQSVVPKGGAQREVLHDDSTDVVVMADDRSSVSMERLDITAYNNLCGRLVDDARLQSALCAGTGPNPLHTKGSREAAHVVVEDAANAFEPTDYPLSPLAAGINFLLESVWRWSSTFCGEVVQMSSDGVLIKFPTDGCGKLDRNGVAARSSILGTDLDEVMDVGPQHGKTVEVTVHGKTYQLCAEERAARTALSIHTALERFLDYSENHLVPPELLRCPMVVLYDEGCVAGRLRFHVSKHYSLLSRQIPLMFPLEQVWEEYGATVIITQAVQSRLEGMCLSRPIHYVDVEDLNCYYVPRSGAETERLQRRSAAAAANASPPIEGEAAPDAGPVSPVAYESDDVDDVSEFRASGTIFDLQGIRDLDATSQAYGIFMDEEARTRARRDHWRLIWSRYEEMMSHKEHKDLRLAYTRLMLMEARSMDVNIESVSTQQQQQQQQVGDVSKSSYGASGGDSFSTGIGGKPTPPADIIDITLTPVLQDCYRELQSYRHIYGVPGGEAYSFKKVLDDVVVMLTALGEECTALDMTDNGV